MGPDLDPNCLLDTNQTQQNVGSGQDQNHLTHSLMEIHDFFFEKLILKKTEDIKMLKKFQHTKSYFC